MPGLPPSDMVLHALSLIALAAQAMTAALAAGKRSMDWVGVCMLGCITALGGGTIRDVLLGQRIKVANSCFSAMFQRDDAKSQHQWTEYVRRGGGRYAAALGHPRTIADDRHEIRLRRRPVRRL